MPGMKKSKRPPKDLMVGNTLGSEGTRGADEDRSYAPMTSKRPPKDLIIGNTLGSEGTRGVGAKMYADGGMVRGCKSGQVSGKGYSGQY